MLSESQIARQKLAGHIRMGSNPDTIEQARADLAYARAHQTLSAWSTLPLRQRTELARQLLADDDAPDAA